MVYCFILSLCLYLKARWVYFRQQNNRFYFLTCSTSTFLLISKLRPLIFKVVIGKCMCWLVSFFPFCVLIPILHCSRLFQLWKFPLRISYYSDGFSLYLTHVFSPAAVNTFSVLCVLRIFTITCHEEFHFCVYLFWYSVYFWYLHNYIFSILQEMVNYDPVEKHLLWHWPGILLLFVQFLKHGSFTVSQNSCIFLCCVFLKCVMFFDWVVQFLCFMLEYLYYFLFGPFYW